MDSWELKDIQIPPIKVQAELSEDKATILLQTEIMGIITTKLIELQSEAIRESLISIGWIPPEKRSKLMPVIESARNVAFEIWDSEDRSWNDVKDAMCGLIDSIEELDKSENTP